MTKTERDSFVFYRSFYEAIKDVPKRHRPVIYESVFEYVFEQKEPQLDGIPSAIWKLIRPQIDSSAKRYENAKKGAEYGKLGGRPKKKETNKKPLKGYESETLNVNVNENVNVNDNVNVNVPGVSEQPTLAADNTHTERVFENKPTQKELADEILKEDYRMSYSSVEGFLKYNEEREWPMPWKDALRRWNELQREQKPKPFVNKFQNFERNHGNDEMAKKIIQMQIGGGT